MTLNLGRYSDTGICHLETNQHIVSGLLDLRDTQEDFAHRSELDGVGQEVVENLTQTVWITAQSAWDVRIQDECEFKLFGSDNRTKSIDDALYQSGEIEIELFEYQFAGRELREVEYVVDD